MGLSPDQTFHHLPIIQNFPELAGRLPHVPLGDFPTPVHRLQGERGAELWIKRDDLSGSGYGGNKVRKLEFILGDVRQRNKSHVVTIGGIGTNHGLATAFYCRRQAIACTLILFPQPVTPKVRRQLLIFHALGARILYYPSVLRAGAAYYLDCRLRFPRAYFLFAGGSTSVGTIGYVNAALELCQQIAAGQMPEPKIIFCPFGSGGTLAGITLGCRLGGLSSRIRGIQVTPPSIGPLPVMTAETVSRLIKSTHRYLNRLGARLPDVDFSPPQIDTAYLGDGYGYPTAAGARAMEILFQAEKIKLEETYTAKTFAAVLDWCRQAENGPVLYWHTYSANDLAEQAAGAGIAELPRPVQRLLQHPA